MNNFQFYSFINYNIAEVVTTKILLLFTLQILSASQIYTSSAVQRTRPARLVKRL